MHPLWRQPVTSASFPPCVLQQASVRWSDRVPAEKLGGAGAELLRAAARRLLLRGYRRFVVVPLFFGPSRTIVSTIPRELQELREQWPGAAWRFGGCLVDTADAADWRVAQILCDHVRCLTVGSGGGHPRSHPAVLVVDHGSPTRAVTAVRDHVAGQVCCN